MGATGARSGQRLPNAALVAVRAAALDLPAGARIAVAMSGGVDSSVVAALLSLAGFEVVGITLRLYDHGRAMARARACCAGRDVRDARAVADHLGVAHYVLDFEERFRRAVIDDFVDAYAAGRTPVPCARCNERVKFGDLLKIARDLGAAALATGHYARRETGPSGPELWIGRDPARDQSYFLFTTTRDQLAYLRFPLGGLEKAATRAHAAALGLPVATKADSQDLCFVPSGDHAAFVRALRPDAGRVGEIVHSSGRVLGHHPGIAGFTPGQRRGLGVAVGEPLYVRSVDAATRRVTVGPRRDGLSTALELEELNWLVSAEPDALDGLVVKHRRNSPASAARVERKGKGARVSFAAAQAAVAPGQACVVYRGDRVLGGGWIASVS